MTWKAIREHTHFNSWAISFLWVVLLLDLIVVHGCLRKEQNDAIKTSKEVTLKTEYMKSELFNLSEDLKAHKQTIHYGH